ncbi:ATP-binding cassette domain-containing protein [uncultured Helcococcus sp.]|uniref:iron ABC transporter ATP-binding protein n=1 Tax=uncultured Helcococcus sp. TaxID=1072508 RepID=UPI0026094D26|nr:ATP-binding cassette domain-containing protein [uncultured Helcococcus sp.]
MIKLENVTKYYSDETVIGPLNFEIKEGGFNSIIGPNGAGKSTTLLMIGRLLDMDTGKINVGGMDVSSCPSEELAKVLSILRQENNFTSRLTVKQLVSFGRYPYSKGRLTERDMEIIDKYINFLELKAFENRYLDELSGGERQRAYVAMVLAQNTKYVLLDEPLNNLDIARSVNMMKYLRKACDELGRTIVLVIHDINFAATFSDRIFAMKNGKLILEGSVDEVMDSKILSDIFETKINVIDSPYGKIAMYN